MPTDARSRPRLLRRTGRALERWGRRRLVRVLALAIRAQDRLRAARPGSDSTPAGAFGAGERVLFLRPDRIGDMIVSTGVLRAIGGAPGVTLDVLASPANAEVLAREVHVHRTIVLDRRRWCAAWQAMRWVRAQRYDVVVDCMPSMPSVTTLLLMLIAGARRRVGASGRGLDRLFTPATPSLPLAAHIVDHLALLAQPFRSTAEPAPDVAPYLELGDDELEAGEARWQAGLAGGSGARLLVNISAGKAARAWPLERYAAVIGAAREETPDLRVAIMSAPHERAKGERLAAQVGGAYLETVTLREAFAVVARADVLFTPDTSIAHAAGALRIPAVDLLLAGKASQWGLYRAPGINLESPDGSLRSLPAQPAADALRRLLRELRDPAHSTPSCWRRKVIVRGQASRVAARLAASSASSRLLGRGSFCARRKPWTAPS